MANQMLFQAGNSLTTGSFFNYFASGFHPSAFWLSVLMIIPETMQAISVLAYRFFFQGKQRKRTWLAGVIAARGFALLIPLSLLFPTDAGQQLTPILWIAVWTTAWYLAQGIAYVNYLSWLSDLAPRSRWGHLFSWRQMAGLMISIFVPLGTLMLRRRVLSQLPDEAERWSYAIIFTTGGLLALLSIFPLLKLPDVPLPRQRQPIQRLTIHWREMWENKSFRYLLASRWTAAFFQGLTQSVLFKYAYDILKIPIETYLILVSFMLVLQLPISWIAGRLCDSQQDCTGLFIGFLIASLAMPCWLMAKAETWWWLIVAYACWGSFALVNICGTSFCLKLAPRGSNLGHLAFYEQVSGLIAGLSGLLGGAVLSALLANTDSSALTGTGLVASFHLLMIISWMGRIIAPLWLLAIRRDN